MSIVFRCPECRHKLRASTSAVGKKCKCKCGTLVKVPDLNNEAETDADEESRGAWQLQPKFNADAGDLCEAITAWSPLCAPRSKSQVLSGSPAAYWQGIVVGSVGVVAVLFVVVALVYAFRPQQPPTEPNPNQQAANLGNPPAGSDADGSKSKNSGNDGSSKKDERKLAGKDDDAKPNGVEDAHTDVPKEPAQDGPKKIDESGTKQDEPKAKIDEPKPPVIDPTRVEIVEWQTHTKVTIEGFRIWTIFDVAWALTEPLELGEDGEKAGLVIVSVKARVPAKALAGKRFVVEGPDVALIAPSANDPSAAIGCAIDDRLWFAPAKGERPYAEARDGVIVETWLFIAHLKDLQSGRTAFQIKDQQAVLLTPNTRRVQAP